MTNKKVSPYIKYGKIPEKNVNIVTKAHIFIYKPACTHKYNTVVYKQGHAMEARCTISWIVNSLNNSLKYL